MFSVKWEHALSLLALYQRSNCKSRWVAHLSNAKLRKLRRIWEAIAASKMSNSIFK